MRLGFLVYFGVAWAPPVSWGLTIWQVICALAFLVGRHCNKARDMPSLTANSMGSKASPHEHQDHSRRRMNSVPWTFCTILDQDFVSLSLGGVYNPPYSDLLPRAFEKPIEEHLREACLATWTCQKLLRLPWLVEHVGVTYARSAQAKIPSSLKRLTNSWKSALKHGNLTRIDAIECCWND